MSNMWETDSSTGSDDSTTDEDSIVIKEEDEESTCSDSTSGTPEEKRKYMDKENSDTEDHGLPSHPKTPRKKMKLMQSVQHPTVNTRSVTRRLYSEGCVWDPPTLEDENEMREWPVEGLLERPVWPDPRYEIPTPPVSELEVILHHSLHAVIGYVVQRAQLLDSYPPTEEERRTQCKHLYDLMLNTGLLYCLVCRVSQNDLADYIDSLSAETVSQWLQELE